MKPCIELVIGVTGVYGIVLGSVRAFCCGADIKTYVLCWALKPQNA